MCSEGFLPACIQRSRRTGRWHRLSRTRGWWRRWSSCTDWCTELVVSRLPAESWAETERETQLSSSNHQLYLYQAQTNSNQHSLPFIRDTVGVWSNFKISMETALHGWNCSGASCTQATRSKRSKGLESVLLQDHHTTNMQLYYCSYVRLNTCLGSKVTGKISNWSPKEIITDSEIRIFPIFNFFFLTHFDLQRFDNWFWIWTKKRSH